MKYFSVTIKPTDYCNLDCTYCYSPNKREINRIDKSLLEKLANKLKDQHPEEQHFLIVWHGSEPMAVGLDFYKVALGIFKDILKDNVQHHIQTNLTVLDDDWINFFIENDISLSTSIDGPKNVHDKQRVNFSGKGTFDLVYKNIKRLKQAGVAISAIVVVNQANLHTAAELFTICKELDLSVRVNPVIISEHSTELIPSEAYGDFLVELARLWLYDPEVSFELQPIHSMALRLLSGNATLCEQNALCYKHMKGFGTNGHVYPCNRFIGVKEFDFGHIDNFDFRIIHSQPLSRKVQNRPSDNHKCSKCDLLHVCQGGCMYHSHVIFGDAFREDYYCKSYFRIFDFLTANIFFILDKIGIRSEDEIPGSVPVY